MSNDISYTPEEVAKILKISKFTVYEMIKREELSAYRIGRKIRIESTDLEKYIQKSKGNLPPVPFKIPSSGSQTDFSSYKQADPRLTDHRSAFDDGLVICGQDVVLDILTRYLERQFPHVHFLRCYIGSIDGLISLYRGTANVVAVHLWDSDTDEYNIPYVRRILPGHPTYIINLLYRIEGFYVAKGNPKKIMTWSDLTRPDVRLINRERGSGARVLLDEKLRVLGINHKTILGYENEEMTHLAVASRVARSEADVGLGIEKVAMQVSGLDFIPLQKERYDLVVRKEDFERPYFKAIMCVLESPSFHNEVMGIGGYDLSSIGKIIAEV